MTRMPIYQNRRPKIYYATQVATQPPTIVLMCNEPNAYPNDYRRYLLSVMRDYLPFSEVPIKLYLQKRSRETKVPTKKRKSLAATAPLESDEDPKHQAPRP